LITEELKDRLKSIMRRYIRKNPGVSHESIISHLLSLIDDVRPFDGLYSIENAHRQQIEEGKRHKLEAHAWISAQEGGELAMAAVNLAAGRIVVGDERFWYGQILELNPDRIRQLSLAGAMCAFEIDRMVHHRKDQDGSGSGSSCASGRCAPRTSSGGLT
jgi:hypothetical protein